MIFSGKFKPGNFNPFFAFGISLMCAIFAYLSPEGTGQHWSALEFIFGLGLLGFFIYGVVIIIIAWNEEYLE